jgi:hypothetical protein
LPVFAVEFDGKSDTGRQRLQGGADRDLSRPSLQQVKG